MSLTSFLMIAGMAIGIFLGMLLITLKRGNRKANRLLGVLMFIASLCIGGFAYTKFHLYLTAPHLIETASTLIFLLGPVLFIYIRALIEKDFTLRSKDLLHFIPFLLLLLYLAPFYLQSAEAKLIKYDTRGFKLEHKVIIIIQLIHVFVYLYVIKRYFSLFKMKTKIIASSEDEINLKWINFIVNLFIIVLGINLFVMALGYIDTLLGSHLIGINLQRVHSVLIPLLISLLVFWLGFRRLKELIIFPSEGEASRNKKYEKSTLTEAQASKSLEDLLTLMKEEKLYLQRDLTLQKLSERISISPHHLSQIINEKLKQNFFDFVNSYRIEEAKSMLVDGRGELLTIIAIGEEVGFNSKSSFNSAFKKHTGKTPSQFRVEYTPGK